MSKAINKMLGEGYSPLYFLNALGAGGLAISFYMYLMWMTAHSGSPIPNYDTLTMQFAGAPHAIQALTLIGLLGIAYYAFVHVRFLFWNFRNYTAWKKTKAYTALRESNGESQLMAIPLALAMTVNLSFIVGAVFVPGVWSVREFLFPIAFLAFGSVGVWAVRIYLDFFSRVLTQGGYDCSKSNNLGQMVSVFSFGMIGVGFSAIAAMSHVPVMSVLGFVASTFFVAAALVLGVVTLVLGFRSMMENKAAVETTPTLWIVIPILTVVGIAIYRLKMTLIHNFGAAPDPTEMFAYVISVFAIQLFFGLIGWAVMRRNGYFEKWVKGKEFSVGSYALICPGVGLFVFANFVINIGLVKLGLVEPLSWGYAALYVPLVVLQFLTVRLFVWLNRKAP